MAEVGLLLGLVSAELHLVGVDHDYVVAGVEVRGVDGFVLAAEDASDLGGHAAQDLPGSVDHEPLVLDLSRLDGIRLHDTPLCKRAPPCAPRPPVFARPWMV